MAVIERNTDHPKKRRRRDDLTAASFACLHLDEDLRGDLGSLSQDLLTQLYPEWQAANTNLSNGSDERTLYVAIQPWTPLVPLVEEIPWTIIPVHNPADASNFSQGAPSPAVRYPAASTTLVSFFKSLEALDPGHSLRNTQKPIEIRVQPVAPLLLESVVVTVQKDLIKTVDEVQNQFGGGFQNGTDRAHARKDIRRNLLTQKLNDGRVFQSAEAEDRLREAIRGGLSYPKVVHSGDILSLPLPSHPITHAPPPPAIVVDCEPVIQGILTAKTKIVLIQTQSSHERAIRKLQPSKPMKQLPEDDAEDTSNEQFYSAAEERESEAPSEIDGVSENESTVDGSSDVDSEASDDSLEDMISLSAPGLPPQPSGTLSAMTTATPRPSGRRVNGAQTPGSVYSSYTATTTRFNRPVGKTFKAEMLLKIVPASALFPRPAENEDEDAFVFVDINMLAKIGCFSGDWVRMEATGNPSNGPFTSLMFNGSDSETGNDWRAVRIFGLPGLANSRPRYTVDKTGDKRTSFSQLTTPMSVSTVYLSPLLFGSLGESTHVKLGPLSSVARLPKHIAPEIKAPSTKVPPIATEIVLTKIQTPQSTERTLDQAIFARLQKYFESKTRLLKAGDLIGLDVDEELSKAMYSPAKSAELNNEADLTEALSKSPVQKKVRHALIWFGVRHVSVEPPLKSGTDSEDNSWGGVALTDVNSTTIRQAGTETRRIPLKLLNHWQYWYGMKKITPPPPPPKSLLFPPRPMQPYISSTLIRLSNLVSAITSCRAIRFGQPALVVLLHSNQRQVGKTYTATQACAAAGVHVFPISAYDVLAESSSASGGGDVKTEGYLTARAERALQCGSQATALMIQHIEQLTADRMLPALKKIIQTCRVLIATTTEIEKIPEGVRGLFTHELEIKAPDESEREGILENAVSDMSIKLSPLVSLRSVALKTAALVAGDLVDVVYRASIARSHRIANLIENQNASSTLPHHIDMASVLLSGGIFTTHVLPSDFDTAITAARAAFSASISAPRIPSVTWDDVGGLTNAKDAIKETIELPLQHPSLFAKGLRKRSGILFYGPPGTGKTLLAKAIATEYSLNFFSVKGPELLNMYIGESEANVRRVFQRARDARPCVVFFDELDSVAPKRGNQGDSGGVMDRIVSQLLAELDGMSSGSSSDGASAEGENSGSAGGGAGVFVIGATNRPDLLDPALLRPGRFDKMIYLGIPDTHEKQLNILQALTRKFTLAPEVGLHSVANHLPLTYTGADLYALASDAMLKAVTRKADETDAKVNRLNEERRLKGAEEVSTAWFFDHIATDEDIRVLVNENDFNDASRELVGSVSEKELKHFERIRRTFEGSPNNAASAQANPSQGTMEERMRTLLNSPQQRMLPLRTDSSHGTAAANDAVSPPQLSFSNPPPRRPEPTNRRSSVEAITKPNGTTEPHSGKGKGKSKHVIGNPDSGPETDEDNHVFGGRLRPTLNGIDDVQGSSGDDFVIDTSHLAQRGNHNAAASENNTVKGKAKGKLVDHQGLGNDIDAEGGSGFMSFDEKDEDLYS